VKLSYRKKKNLKILFLKV